MQAPRSPRVLLLSGWHNSGDGHWQTRWESLHGDFRVLQSDWEVPLRGDWMARLDEVIVGLPSKTQHDNQHGTAPVMLAAHSLGCHLVAAWAAHSRHTARVAGALLVAPPDPYQPSLPPQLHSWRKPVLERLPFPSTLVHSDDDPYSPDPAFATRTAQAWGSERVNLGSRGHINANSGLGDWPAGRSLLWSLTQRQRHATRLLTLSADDCRDLIAGAQRLRGYTPAAPDALPPPLLLQRGVNDPGGLAVPQLLVDEATQTIVGAGGIKGPAHPELGLEIGYNVSAGLRGNGYATCFIHHLLDRTGALGQRSVWAETATDNPASGRALAKAGFTPVVQRQSESNGQTSGNLQRWQRRW